MPLHWMWFVLTVPKVVYGHVASKGASQVLYVFRGMSEMVGCCFQLRGCW